MSDFKWWGKKKRLSGLETRIAKFFFFECQTSGVRSMTFNPDGRTLLCGLHESLKVEIIFSFLFSCFLYSIINLYLH